MARLESIRLGVQDNHDGDTHVDPENHDHYASFALQQGSENHNHFKLF